MDVARSYLAATFKRCYNDYVAVDGRAYCNHKKFSSLVKKAVGRATATPAPEPAPAPARRGLLNWL